MDDRSSESDRGSERAAELESDRDSAPAHPPETAVDWRPFDDETFAAARDADRPVLLSLTARWCIECHEMDREVYANPALAERIEADFVPVRVDADRRPRVRDRYNVGGFPSTVFLTPAGEVLTGATRLGPDAFRDVLESVGGVWADRGTAAGRIPRAVDSEPPAGQVEGADRLVAGTLRTEFDADHGGWGAGPKFPLPRTVEFALKRDPELATRTLDPIRQHLLDTYDGGFFRYAAEPDWSDPSREKLTDENAALCRVFANAYLHTGDVAYRETAADVVDFLTTTLWTGEAFAGSQVPADESYYRRSPADREDAPDPPVDRTAFADRNAVAVGALLTYHAYTDDEPTRRYAERALRTLSGLIAEDGTVRHFGADDAPAGLLVDQASVAGAFVTAAQVLDRSHQATAATVADRAIEDLRTEVGLADGPLDGPGLLDRPLYSIDAAAALADALVDLHALTGEGRYHEAARDALSAFGGARERFGPRVAHFATAVARLDGVLRIEVGTSAGSDLHRAALRVADHEKVVVIEADGPPDGTVVVDDGDRSEPADTPAELLDRIEGRRG